MWGLARERVTTAVFLLKEPCNDFVMKTIWKGKYKHIHIYAIALSTPFYRFKLRSHFYIAPVLQQQYSRKYERHHNTQSTRSLIGSHLMITKWVDLKKWENVKGKKTKNRKWKWVWGWFKKKEIRMQNLSITKMW